MEEDKILHSSFIANIVLNAFLSWTAIALNSITIQALIKTTFPKQPSKTLLLSLAVSDLCVGILIHPMFIALIIIRVQENSENSSTFNSMYTAFVTAVNIIGSTSVFGVMAISADRFLAIHLHLRYQELVTRKRALIVVSLMWVFSVFSSLLRLTIQQHVYYSFFVVIAISGFLITTWFHYKIYKAVRYHTNQIQAAHLQHTAQNANIDGARVRNFAIATCFIYLAILVCYFPRICTYVVFAILGTTTTTTGLRLYSMTLAFLSSTLNPLIYCWKMRHIRQAVVEMLRKIWQGFK